MIFICFFSKVESIYFYTYIIKLGMQDHLLPTKQLLQKYGLDEINSSKSVTDDPNLNNLGRQERINQIFPNKDFSVWYIFLSSFVSPVKLLSLFSIITLITIYFISQEDKTYFSYFFFTLFFILSLSIIESYQINKINSYYKKKEIIYNSKILINDQEFNLENQYVQLGDILVLKEGDVVAADCILLDSRDMVIDRSFLIGKPKYIKKSYLETSLNFEISPNVLFCSDKIVSGQGLALVVRVGKKTKIGDFYKKNIKPKNLQRLLLKEINLIFLFSLVAALILSFSLIFIGFSTGIKLKKSISLTLSICLTLIPNRIPSIITLMLSTAVFKLENKGITIRDAGVIEKLGLLTVVCAEKNAFVGQLNTFCSCIYTGHRLIDIELAFEDQDVDSLYYLERITGITSLIAKNKSIKFQKKYHQPFELLSEILLKYFGRSVGTLIKKQELNTKDFDGTILSDEGDETPDYLYITGSVESILNICNTIQVNFIKCNLSSEKKIKILQVIEDLKANFSGFVALAYKVFDTANENFEQSEFTFVCIYFLEKFPAPDTSLITTAFKTSHINFSFVTAAKTKSLSDLFKIIQGFEVYDLPFDENISSSQRVLSGVQYKAGDANSRSAFLKNKNFIVYKTNQNVKNQITKNLQELNHIVCFIGSSISDCKAMNRADIGVCFEDSGALSKEACNIVLANGRIEDFLYCIEEGRLLLVNLRKAIRFITSHIVPQIAPYALYACFGVPIAFPPLLLIVLNYIIELPSAIAFAYEEPEYNLLIEKPIKKDKIKSQLQEINNEDQYGFRNPYNIASAFERMRKHSLTYHLTTVTFSVIETGTITATFCMLSFFLSLYLDEVPISKMFFSANTYFLTHHSSLLTLRDGSEIGSEEQLDILWRGQSSFFLSLVLCQMTTLMVCRRTRNYFFTNFFNNYSIILYAFLGILLAIICLYARFLEPVLFLKPPKALILVCPVIAIFLILSIDTFRKYRLKR